MAIFHNATAGLLKLSRIKFTTEAYRANSTANNFDSIFVWYKTGPDELSLTTNNIATTASNTTEFINGTNTTTPTSYYITGWTNLPEFTRVTTNTTASAVLPPETNTFDAAPSSSTVLVPAGAYLAIRWSNINDGGTDAIHGFDDLQLTFEAATGCVVTATASNIVRLPGANAALATDDSVSFTLNATASGGAPAGWVVPAAGFAGGTSGAYGANVNVTLPIADFGASGTGTARVQDAVDAGCFSNVVVAAPPFIQPVTAANSPKITFTPSANGDASYSPPAADQSELGWTGGTAGANTNSNVQTQPDSGAFIGTNKYWHLTTATTTFTTNPVSLAAVAGQTLKGHVDLSFYSTSGTVLDVGDVLNARLEVALDGDFNNTTAGNILTENFVDLTATGDAPGLSAELAAAATYMDLTNAGYPTADFIFHPYEKTIPVPAGASNARARVVFASGAGVSNSEHVLLDNVSFSIATVEPDTDGDGMTDAYEDANGLDKNTSADRNTDLDGDGRTNYLESVAGTTANDPTSNLRFLTASISAANEISGTWTSVAGKRYQAEVSTDLTTWTSLPGVITATGPITAVPPGIIVPPGNPKYFLRVEVVP